GGKEGNKVVWAVLDGNVSAVPVPAAIWLFGSGLIGISMAAKRKSVGIR
ncbi:MAG: VPLPA-CTERM sorting domain-containing protein, partial [Gammaproteobacteria bacterium]|nr:VPLPA-CTERM sorting domain-containing protein [Gammaproteobacteria bacterium]